MNFAPEINMGHGLFHAGRDVATEPKSQKIALRFGRTFESAQKIMRFQGGFQDAEGILTAQMLVAAILLSIVVSLHTGTFSHDALVAGDLRHATFDAVRGKELENDSFERFLSGRLFVDGYVAVSCSAYSLLSAAAIYVSLIFSGAREKPALFQCWWRFGRICVLLGYVALLVSIIFFLRLNHDSVYLVYPKYNWNDVLNISDTLDFAQGLSAVPRSLGAARGSSAAGTSVGQESDAKSSFSHSVGEDGRHYGQDVADVSKNVKLFMNVALGLTAVILAVGHTWINWCHLGSDAIEPPPQSPTREKALAAEHMALQNKLLKAQNELLQQFLQRQLPAASGVSISSRSSHWSYDAAKRIGTSWPVHAFDIEAQRCITSVSAGAPLVSCADLSPTLADTTPRVSEACGGTTLDSSGKREASFM